MEIINLTRHTPYAIRRSSIRGFTLIEIIVSMGILGIIATMGTNLLFSILGGSAKAKVLQSVKQNGGYALSVMESMIRNARKLDYVLSPTDAITITNPDGGITTFHCYDSPDSLIASESGTLLGVAARITGQEVKVDDTSCANFFTITPGIPGVRPNLVVIQFKLIQSGVSSRPEEQTSVDFQTTVGLRNY